MGLRDEFEPKEWSAITADLGQLPEQEMINLWWRMEGAAALLWALKHIEIPPYDNYVQGETLWAAMDFLNDDARHLLAHPTLRSDDDLSWYAEFTLMIHWRLREYTLRPKPLNFVEFAKNCQWAMMPIDDVQIIESDLAIRGQPVSRASEEVFRECLSIARERQQAANRLIGQAEIYSEVTCDT